MNKINLNNSLLDPVLSLKQKDSLPFQLKSEYSILFWQNSLAPSWMKYRFLLKEYYHSKIPLETGDVCYVRCASLPAQD